MIRAGIATLVALAMTGCGGKPAVPAVDTGARDTATTFYNGLISGEPSVSFEVLDPESQQRISREQFTRLAQTYAKNIGFPVEKVHIQACEEQGDAATAHVVLLGRAAGHSHRFSDGIALRRADGRWGVTLPRNFGHKLK